MVREMPVLTWGLDGGEELGTRHPRGKTILVVNDDPAILGLFDDLLSEEGYGVIQDEFGKTTDELHHHIRDLQPDLIILDFIIGREGSGWQLLQTIKMDRATRQIPVIVCTGAVRQIEELRGRLLEMDVRVVLKPFDIDHLIEVIESIWRQDNKVPVSSS
jgi:DNA-binding response OmpR family regulator